MSRTGRTRAWDEVLSSFDQRYQLTTARQNLSESDRRFDVELFIVHPTIDPSDITIALGLEATRSSRVGDPRITPKGTLLDRAPALLREIHGHRATCV